MALGIRWWNNFSQFVTKSRIARFAVIASVAQCVTQLALEIGVDLIFLQQMSTVPAVTASSPATIATNRPLAEALPVYHAIYGIAALVQPILTMDSISHQNSIQLITVNVLNVGLFGYSIMQYLQETSVFTKLQTELMAGGYSDIAAGISYPWSSVPSLALHILSIIVSTIFMCTTAYWTWKLSKEYDWAIYRRVGADRGTRKRLNVYFVLMMLLKLDVFFYFTFALQFLVILWKNSSQVSDIIINVCVSLVMIPILYALCSRGARTENKWMTGAFMVGTLAAVGYLLLKLQNVLAQERFYTVRKSLSFAIAACIAMALITFGYTYLAYRNFGQGLVSALDRPQSPVAQKLNSVAAPPASSATGPATPLAAEHGAGH
ncbi:hypothetical protein BC828DRAFT_382908 [Blastocladiella britannica]|nr:hypothetical protein BC828DRAFT_382908 [Blastocladiella britannica]